MCGVYVPDGAGRYIADDRVCDNCLDILAHIIAEVSDQETLEGQ